MTGNGTTRGSNAKLWRGIGVRAGEGPMALWISLLFVVTQASHGLGMNTADTLFFLRFGVDRLPLMILISGVAVMGAITLHVVGLGVAGPRRWLWIATSVPALWLVLERIAVAADWPAIYPVIWIANQAIMMVTLTVMWNAAEQSCDTRQAKRLFPLFATAGVIGGVAGNAMTGPLAGSLGTTNLLLIQAGLLVASTAILSGVKPFFRAVEDQSSVSVWSALLLTPGRALASRLGRLAALAALLVSTLFFLVVFPFNEMVADSFPTEVEVAGFLGLFSSVATAATFVFSLLATRWLFGRLGVVVTLLIVPIVYAAGFGLLLVDFGLVSVVLVRGLQWVAVNAIWGTAYAALFNVVPGGQRSRTLGFMIAVPAQIGTVIAGGLLLIGEAIPQAIGFGIGAALGVAASWIIYQMRPAYLDSVMSAVRHGLAGIFTLQPRDISNPTDRDASRILTEYLQDERPQARAFAAAALARLGESGAAPQVKGLLDDPSPTVRSAALDSMCIIEPEGLVDHVAAAMSDEMAAVRLQAVRYLIGQPGEVAEALISSQLDDPDERVRAAAAVALDNEDGRRIEGEMLTSQSPRAVAAILEETTRAGRSLRTARPDDFLDHPDSRVRMAAVSSGAGRGEPGALVRLLEDPSPRVRRATARALTSVPGGHQLLVEVLQTGSVNATDAALSALVPLDELEPGLANWAESEARRAALLADRGRALAATPNQSPTLSFLVSVLSSRSHRLIGWVIAASTTRQTQQVMPVVDRGVRSRDAETRAQATEALETIGARSVLKVLIPLLETPDHGDAIDRRSVLGALSEDFDPWIKALALRALAEEMRDDFRSLQQIAGEDDSDIVRSAVAGLSPMADTIETLDPMDRTLALHVVHMFRGLDPEDLELIAASMTEVRYEPGERIYTDGDAGDEMLVIVGGSATVSKERDGVRRTVSGYGPGHIVGELAVLLGGRRIADVDAGETGLHGLALTGADLLSILEERPSVGMGMLGTLASRLADQT